jgi:hypothetical protein
VPANVRTFELRLGAISDPIRKQLKQQGINAPASKVNKWQKAADAINMLYVNSIIHASVAEGARRRLFEFIRRELRG